MIKVVSFVHAETGRVVRAVRAPSSETDAAPWHVYTDGVFRGRVEDERIPANATVEYESSGGFAVQDGSYYRVIVDGRWRGIGVRNSPLTQASPDAPWVVRLEDEHGPAASLTTASDSSVKAIDPL